MSYQKSKSSGNLALLKKSGSTSRVLNLVSVRDRFGDDPEYAARPLFLQRRLNEALILKHSPRQDEKEAFGLTGSVATKIIFPFSTKDISLGGQSLFVEHATFARHLAEMTGCQPTDERFVRDMQILDEIARLPSLDPYLLRERVSRMSMTVSRVYFDISEADMARMHEHVSAEIRKLVDLAFSATGSDTNSLSNKLARFLLEDETADALSPLRDTLRLSPAEYREGMFGWKGFLYYKWRARDFQKDLSPIAKEMLSIRILRANLDDKAFLDQVRQRIVERLGLAANEIKSALGRYDAAYNVLISDGQPGKFRSFLLTAPQMFVQTGEHLAALQHITSFWRFRFKPGQARTIDVEEAYDLFQEFEGSLSGVAPAAERGAA